MNVARYVDDQSRAQRDELFDEGLVASSPGRINHDRGPLRRELNRRKDVFGITGEEFDVLHAVQLGVALGIGDGLGGDLHSRNLFEQWAKAQSKEARAAVGVDEIVLLIWVC